MCKFQKNAVQKLPALHIQPQKWLKTANRFRIHPQPSVENQPHGLSFGQTDCLILDVPLLQIQKFIFFLSDILCNSAVYKHSFSRIFLIYWQFYILQNRQFFKYMILIFTSVYDSKPAPDSSIFLLCLIFFSANPDRTVIKSSSQQCPSEFPAKFVLYVIDSKYSPLLQPKVVLLI